MHPTAARNHLTEAEYLALEAESEERHELINGEVVAMAGGSPAHNTIIANLTRELGRLLRQRPCIVMSSDQRVNVEATGLYTYPDLTVVCGGPQFGLKGSTTLLNPTVVVEVLSEATELYDRGAKAAHYRRLASLQAYVLVSQKPRRIEVFQRTPEGRWLLHEAEEGEVEIPALDVRLSLEEVYLHVDLLEALATGPS